MANFSIGLNLKLEEHVTVTLGSIRVAYRKVAQGLWRDDRGGVGGARGITAPDSCVAFIDSVGAGFACRALLAPSVTGEKRPQCDQHEAEVQATEHARARYTPTERCRSRNFRRGVPQFCSDQAPALLPLSRGEPRKAGALRLGGHVGRTDHGARADVAGL